ncbi:MAG: serine hydrolase [Bacteroidota bacterium]
MKKLLLPLIGCLIWGLWACQSSAPATAIEAAEWPAWEESELQAWDSEGLNRLQRYVVDSTVFTGIMIVQGGKVVGDYGNIEENSYIASCRKSVLAMLYGPYVKDGTIDLSLSLEELGIDDVGGLLEIEKRATIKDLIAARSGVYHPASNGGDFLDQAPERGSQEPGAYWLYSNWDFNAAGFIFEKLTGKNIYDEVERQLAIPLGMQDWERDLQRKSGDTTRSFYRAYHMWFSVRDLARIGQLMLQKGSWQGEQLYDPAWIAEMVAPLTSSQEILDNVPGFGRVGYRFGYGYMWWLWDEPDIPQLNGAYSALGAMGQSITVYPAIDAVVALKTNSLYGRRNSGHQRARVLALVAQAYRQP